MDLFLDPILNKHAALIEVAATYAILWIVGRIFTRASKKIAIKHAATPKKVGEGVLRGLHISGVTEELIVFIEALTQKKDTLKLAMYLAIYQPTIIEVEELLQAAEDHRRHAQINSGDDDAFLIMAQADSECESIKRLNPDELRALSYLHNKPRKLINRDFITRFGDLLFMENFIIYMHLSRSGTTVFDIPQDSQLRRMFEGFVITGLATHGKNISIEDRLRVLGLDELQAIARDLDVESEFASVEDTIAKLAPLPNVSVRLGKNHPSSKLFLLKKENWNSQEIEKEWVGYNVYAKFLCTATVEELAVTPKTETKSLSYA